MSENLTSVGSSVEKKVTVIPLVKLRKLFFVLGISALCFFGGYTLGRQDAIPLLNKEMGLSQNTGSLGMSVTGLNLTGKVNAEDVDMALFWDVWNQLKQRYLDQTKLDSSKMVYGAIKGMVASLDDPYTVFLTPDENKRSQEDLQGSFSGVGIQLGYKDDPDTTAEERWLAVISPLEGTPAFEAGIKAGELILKIDGKTTSGMSVPEAVELIRGEKGTTVTLTLLPSVGEEAHDVDVVRQEIDVPSVTMEFVESDGKRAARLKVSRFGEKTTEELIDFAKKILAEDKAGKLNGVVLDLRGNPGGYFNKAIDMIGMFVESGVAVLQEDAQGKREPFRVDGKNPLLKDVPLVVLIDQGSASSSEITAGALRELRQVKLVGMTSFGKGTVQAAEDYPGGAGIHITIDRWLLPSGASIHKVGVKPDVEVEYKAGENEALDTQLEKALEVL